MGNPSQTNYSTRDSIFKNYMSLIDTLPYYDTSTIEHQLIKAYFSNDINSLKKLVRRVEHLNTTPSWRNDMDSCVKQQAFKDIEAEEKYRFNYSSAFCPYTTSITIIKYKDSNVLNTIVYQHAWDTLPCRIIDKSTNTIDSISWEKFN
jgi:hypothetical protein